VGTHDGRTQSARAWLFFFLHLDGLKTPIYTQTIVKWNWWWDTKEGERTTTQTPTLPFTPNPSPKKPKKPNTLFFFFSTNPWYIDTYPKNLILEAIMQVLLGAATAGFQDSDRRTRLPSSVAAVLLHLALRTWLSGPGSLVAGGQLSLWPVLP
jgi:hypothetical protein